MCLRPLTFASVLVESSNPATIVDQRAVVEEECGGTVRESPVVEMIQPGKYQIYPVIKCDDNGQANIARPVSGGTVECVSSPAVVG